MRLFAFLLLIAIAGPVAAEGTWTPDPRDERQVAAGEMLELIRSVEGEEFDAMFELAHAYVVFPALKRAGLLLGWAQGRGVLVEGGKFTGYVRQRRFSLGFQFGYQKQGQIILFRNAEILEQFKEGGKQFTPQASAHASKNRRAADGSFHPDVAVFSVTEKGLMVEAAIGGSGFKFIEPR